MINYLFEVRLCNEYDKLGAHQVKKYLTFRSKKTLQEMFVEIAKKYDEIVHIKFVDNYEQVE